MIPGPETEATTPSIGGASVLDAFYTGGGVNTVFIDMSTGLPNATSYFCAWTAQESSYFEILISGVALNALRAGVSLTLRILNDATSARTTTPGGGVLRHAGPVVGTISKIATMHFQFDGTNFIELSRTLGMT